MKIRKIKKRIKRTNDEWFIKTSLGSLKRIKQWQKINNEYSKRNMKILTQNFLWRGILLCKEN